MVEAKAIYRLPGDGLQQAKGYAEILGLNFAYSSNGEGIIEFDFSTGREQELPSFPTPEALWSRLRASDGLSDDASATRLLTPDNLTGRKEPRYYQRIAIQRVVEAILKGEHRVLLTMATGTGKTETAFQICWKLWSSRWNRTGEYRKPRILYLADRNFLVDDPKARPSPPSATRATRSRAEVVKSREMYFAIYQAIAHDEHRPGLYKEYPPDFFDLIIVDECHRGSASDESNWREILEYFEPAFQLGMTATPKRDDNLDTYLYFGNPIYTYSLRRASTTVSWRPTASIASSDHVGRGRLAPEQGRARPLRPRDPRRGVPHRAVRASRRPPGQNRGDCQTPDRLLEGYRPLRQDHRLLRGPGARRRDAAGAAQTSTAILSANTRTTSAA